MNEELMNVWIKNWWMNKELMNELTKELADEGMKGEFL